MLKRRPKSIPVSELARYAANPEGTLNARGPDNRAAARYGVAAHRRAGHSAWHGIIQGLANLIFVLIILGLAYWLWTL